MSETSGNQGPRPQDPELSASQVAMKSLCDEVLALKPEHLHFVNFEDVISGANPSEVQERLRASSLGDLMLKDGDSLSAIRTSDYYPDLDLFVGGARLVGVGVRAFGWEDDKRRIDPNGSDKPPYDIIDYPGEKDWIHQLDIKLWYSNGKQEACQTITAYTSSKAAGCHPCHGMSRLQPM